MAVQLGGAQVRGGYYVNGRTFEFATVAVDGGRLPGGAEARWLRVPTPLVFFVAPVLGALFVVALPLIGFGYVGYELARKLHLLPRQHPVSPSPGAT